jgi:glycosyltransferase involved in cell wall biosynthesis
VILAVGRLQPQKDFPLLIEAFGRVRATRPARLLILGEGPDHTALQQQVDAAGLTADVALPGFDANPYAYMKQAAAFVLSSRWEGLPGVLIEALYCGTPLIATDCPSGPKEILANGAYGRLIPMREVTAMTAALQAALGGEIARPPADSWRPFELNTVVDKYLRLLVNPTRTQQSLEKVVGNYA